MELKLAELNAHLLIAAMNSVGFGVARLTWTQVGQATPPVRVGETVTFTILPVTVESTPIPLAAALAFAPTFVDPL